MIQITSLTNSFILNGRLYQKGSLTFTPTPNGLSVSNFSASFANITIDGETFDNMEDLRNALNEKVFKSGGGSTGEGVQSITWDNVQAKPLKTLATPIEQAEGLIPVYTQAGHLPVGIPEFPENAVPLVLLDARLAQIQSGSIQSVNNKTDADIILNYEDVGADQAGSIRGFN